MGLIITSFHECLTYAIYFWYVFMCQGQFKSILEMLALAQYEAKYRTGVLWQLAGCEDEGNVLISDALSGMTSLHTFAMGRPNTTLTRSGGALADPFECTFSRIERSMDSSACLVHWGVDWDTWDKWASGLTQAWPEMDIRMLRSQFERTGGRLRIMDSRRKLGVLLKWWHSRDPQRHIAEFAGIVPSSISDTLSLRPERNEVHFRFTRLLEGTPHVRPWWPDFEGREYFSSIICHNDPPVFEETLHPSHFTDGVLLPCEEHPVVVESDKFKTALKDGYNCNSVVTAAPVGLVSHANLNKYGIHNDWTIFSGPGGLLDKLIGDYRHQIIADGIFRYGRSWGYVLTPGKATDPPINEHGLAALVEKQHRWTVRKRQAAEWIMGGLQRTNPRLREPLPWQEDYRNQLLKEVILMWNARTLSMGHNQVRTVYWDAICAVDLQYAVQARVEVLRRRANGEDVADVVDSWSSGYRAEEMRALVMQALHAEEVDVEVD